MELNQKKILRGLDHDAYEHEFDKAALDALEGTWGLEAFAKWVTSNFIERVFDVQYRGSNIRVTKESYPKIYAYLEQACKILDMPKVPECYIQWGYDINAFTVGSENPIIVLNSGLIDLCDEDEIMFIIGHELGHIKSNHMLYHMMAQTIDMVLAYVPLVITKILAGGLQYALYYWSRMSEFTADRAGLLCCQNERMAVKAFMKMAGVPRNHFNEMNYETFIQQARDFKAMDLQSMNKIIKTISIADDSHPWTVLRASELLKWIDAGEYERFLSKGV